ncbi:sugar transferase [Slackia piriformis]
MSESKCEIVSEENTAVDSLADNTCGPSDDSDLARIAFAASKVTTEEEAAAVMDGLRDTEGLTESGIAPDVLSKLLPGDEVVVLPQIKQVARGGGYRFFKRAFDIVSCAAALILLAIPMGIIAICVKIESPGPAIYAQRRCGKDGKIFKIYKFRSMYTDAEARGAQWAAGDDPRITPLGKKLRKTRLDEIPQFWNVVKGDMSLIGPRPERPAFSKEFEKRIIGWNQRTMVRPGITGLAQITGGYELLPKEKVLYDIEYIENRSLAMDWSIIWGTLRTMVSGDGAR